MCLNSLDEGVAVKNGRISKLMKSWNERKDFSRIGRPDRVPSYFGFSQMTGRQAATTPVAAGLGAYQPDRRLRLATEQTGRARQVPYTRTVQPVLAYDFPRFVRRPHIHERGVFCDRVESAEMLWKALAHQTRLLPICYLFRFLIFL